MALKLFEHDCDKCQFLGQYIGHDLYSCGDSVIARNGDQGDEYMSSPVEYARDHVLKEAKERRAVLVKMGIL